MFVISSLYVLLWSQPSIAENISVVNFSTQQTQQRLMHGELTANNIQEDCTNSNLCTHWTGNTPHGYADALLQNPSPLRIANTYGIANSLLPTIPETNITHNESTTFFSYRDNHGWLLVVAQQETMTILYAITAEATKPLESPFSKHRLSNLQKNQDLLLKDCHRIKTLTMDSYGNEFAWQGNRCANWDVIVEYNPSTEYTLLGLYYPTTTP